MADIKRRERFEQGKSHVGQLREDGQSTPKHPPYVQFSTVLDYLDILLETGFRMIFLEG